MQTNYYYPQQQEQLITRHQVRQGHAPPQPRRVPSTASSSATGPGLASTLKGLWGKVERSLDDLAGLEDSVAGQAQKLVTSAISTTSAASKLSPSALRSLAYSGVVAAASGVKAATPLGKRNSHRKKGPSIAGGTNVPLKPYGQKYEIAREAKEKNEQQQKNGGQFQPASIVGSNKKVHHLLYSGGGAASSPFGYPQDHPSSPSSGDDDGRTVEAPVDSADAKAHPETNANPGPGASYGATASYGSTLPGHRGPPSPSNDSYGGQRSFHPESQASNRGPPVNLNPIEKRYSSDINGMSRSRPVHASAQPQPGPGGEPKQDPPARDPAQPQPGPGRKPQQDPRDPHSRNNRIPWDTSTSSPNRQAPPSSHTPRSPQSLEKPDYRYEDRDTPSWKRALKSIPLPPLPNLGKLRMPRFRRSKNPYYSNLDAWESTDEGEKSGGIFGFFRKSSSPSSSFSMSSNVLSRNKKQDTNDGQPPLVASMLSRCNNGKTMSLLRSEDEKAIKIIGRYKAILDVLFLVSILLGFKLLSGFDSLISLPSSWHEMLEVTLPKVGAALNELLEGSWALFAFLYAALFKYSSERLLHSKIDSLASTVATSVKEESEYSQLYLRLLAATPMDRHLPDRLASIAKTQVSSLVAKSRLNSFVGIVLASLTVMTVSAVGPILIAIGSAITKIMFLQEWRRWPVPWEGLFGAASAVMQNLFHALESQGASAFRSFLDNPIQFSFHLSMFGSLLLCTLLPGLEERRTVAAKTEDPDDDDVGASNFESAEEWSRLGTSSASRLSMLSENGSVESALARWRASHITPLDESLAYGSGLSSLLRLVGYALVAALLAGSPLVISHFLAGETPSLSNTLSIFRWDSLFDLSFLQFFLFGLVYQTFQKVIESVNNASVVKTFQADLLSTKQEMEESNKINADFQVMGSVSPSAGIAVRDLWAAHATKRAWAVRGANLQCKNGEILAVLGEDGNGKTRLLTTLAEALTHPPKRTTTTNKIRGLIAIGGLDVSKWNHKTLKRRLGILLSDVRMVADSASLFSGWTMEEILEPVDGIRSSDHDPLQRTYTKAEKSAMLLALKITGLYKTLLARLPSKTATIFTANEEDLRHTSLKPRSTVLSPGEWSKMILARVLAQTIYDNDNVLASNDKIQNSLMGSILLLDEPTTMHSEVDEGELFRDLRLTGAATVISTNKWATGRYADQICVVKNGVIVEMGSHNELIARGPQQSLYAAKWQAMTLQ